MVVTAGYQSDASSSPAKLDAPQDLGVVPVCNGLVLAVKWWSGLVGCE
jgi:hypothetical protein